MLVSKLHVNSNNSICFFFLSIITISGLCKVHKMSAGIVLPFSQKFGRSAKISRPLGRLLLRWVEKCTLNKMPTGLKDKIMKIVTPPL